MKIAYITSGDPNNMKGFMNNVQERAVRLIEAAPPDIHFDFYMLRSDASFLFAFLRKTKRRKKENYQKIGKIKYKNLWIRSAVFDYIMTYKLKKRALMGKRQIEEEVDRFKHYDLILSFGTDASHLAFKIKQRYQVPYITSWHGSDINVYPFMSAPAFLLTKNIIANATENHFVSKKLKEKADEITLEGRKEYIYTGPSAIFYQYDEVKRKSLKQQYKVETKTVVGFVGNLVSIKNIPSLPLIFNKVAEHNTDITFWIVGDGPLDKVLKNRLNETGVDFRMFGKVAPEAIPDLMNCLDVLVLPSLNEGLPMVILEALTCGVNVVGSKVGGIPEIIGEKNVFPLGDHFIDNISDRVTEILKNKESPPSLSGQFSWRHAMEEILCAIHKAIEIGDRNISK